MIDNYDLHQELKELLNNFQSNGVLDDSKLLELKEVILRDKSVSQIEASVIFELKDSFETQEFTDSFSTFFVDSITSFLLYSGETPGSLDVKELVWLKDTIGEDKTFSDLEKALLKNLSLRAEKLPADFSDLMKI